MKRRTFLAGAGAALLAGCIPTRTDYGALVASSVPNLWIPQGFTARKVATSWQTVAGYRWPGHPDGGATFDAGDGEWIYTVNSESSDGLGGVSALRFDADGTTLAAYSILTGTSRNCAGGAFYSGSKWWWVSCEEIDRGRAWLCDPMGYEVAQPLSWGRWRREAIAHHLGTNTIYQTEDEPDGCLYRHRLSPVGDWLQVLCTDGTWREVPDPEATTTRTRYQVADARRFNGGEGIYVAGDLVLFTAKGDGKVWRYNIATGALDAAYSSSSPTPRHLSGVDNLVATTSSAFVAEDGGNMEIVGLNLVTGVTNPVVRYDCTGSEMTGPAFSPDGRHLVFSSQRNPGETFMVSGPWHS